LRQAAANARHYFLNSAARRLQVPPSDLETVEGAVRVKANPKRFVRYGDLITDDVVQLKMDEAVPVKSPADYKVVGQPIVRIDTPRKVTGAFPYVHNVRLPGMLHARLILPAAVGVDSIGSNSLLEVDESSIMAVAPLGRPAGDGQSRRSRPRHAVRRAGFARTGQYRTSSNVRSKAACGELFLALPTAWLDRPRLRCGRSIG
jgi:hypothetical protein